MREYTREKQGEESEVNVKTVPLERNEGRKERMTRKFKRGIRSD